jgi:hypothetical protein
VVAESTADRQLLGVVFAVLHRKGDSQMNAANFEIFEGIKVQ